MKDNRLRIALHPEVFKMLEVYKDKIHDHASKRRVPMSWNEFFMIVVNDWESGRTKCICGSFYDCKMCDTEKALSRIKLREHITQKRIVWVTAEKKLRIHPGKM